ARELFPAIHRRLLLRCRKPAYRPWTCSMKLIQYVPLMAVSPGRNRYRNPLLPDAQWEITLKKVSVILLPCGTMRREHYWERAIRCAIKMMLYNRCRVGAALLIV